MKLHFVFVGEAAAVRGALQVFGEIDHHAVGSVATGQDPLVCAVDVVVVPYDHGELFCLHSGSFSWGRSPVLISG